MNRLELRRSLDIAIRNNEIQRLQAGYISTQILNGTYSGIPDFDDKVEPREANTLVAIWETLWSELGDAIYDYFIGSTLRPRRRENEEMKKVLDNLSAHSNDPMIILTQSPAGNYPLRSIIPAMDSTIYSFLKNPPFQPFGEVDAKVLAMAKWFKNGYMSWVDPIKCPTCGKGTTSVGLVTPESEEKRNGAGRVELHICQDGDCGGKRRFPRYNDISMLIKTKEGRCGEWANLFYAFLRAAGIDSRYIWNSEDHVWNEYWSPSLQHWVHVDSCEASTNKPLLYDRGWGKKQAFCLAFGAGGAEDVTRAYVSDWDGACQGRRRAKGWDEKELRRKLLEHTAFQRVRMDITTRQKYAAMDEAQARWIGDERKRMEEAERDELGGRTSGTADWRARRNELGLQTVQKPSYRVTKSIQCNSEDLDFQGNAILTDAGIQLTSAPSQTSAVFASVPLKQTDNFKVEVTFRLTAPPGSGEADGIAIVFSGEKRLGLGGYGLGYSGLGGQGDFAVEIDTYRTQDFADDPPTPHISVHSPPEAHHDHSISCTPDGSIPWLSDGRAYTLELLYEGSTRRLKGILTLPEEEESRTEIMICDTTIPGSADQSGDWFVGLTGSCGGLWQKQEILEWSVEEIVFEESQSLGSPTEPSEVPLRNDLDNGLADGTVNGIQKARFSGRGL